METQKRCAACALEIPLEAKKCPHCRARQPGASTFHRPREGRMIAGVCAGIASELGMDPIVVRLVFAVAALASFGLAFWCYIILWMITPVARFEDAPLTRLVEWMRRLFSPGPSTAPVSDDARR